MCLVNKHWRRMNNFGQLMNSSQVQNLLSAFGITIIGLILYHLFFFLLKRSKRRRKSTFYKLIRDKIYHAGQFLIFIATLLVGLPIAGKYLSDEIFYTIRHVLFILLIIAASILLIRALTVLRELGLKHYKTIDDDTEFSLRRVKTKFILVQRILNIIIVIVMVSVILMTFENVRKIGSTLLASAGVFGLVLGFAAQKSIGTFFAGLQIAISQPIKIDDVVVVEDEFGTIGEINLTYVVVNIWDGRRLIVPVNYFLDKSFENWTRLSPKVIGKVKIYTDYSLPIDELRQQFIKWLEASPLWDKRKSGFLVTEATDKTIEIRATMSARNSDDSFDLECLIREKLITYIQQNYPGALPKSRISVESKKIENSNEQKTINYKTIP